MSIKTLIFLFLSLVFSFLPVMAARAATALDVVINEIAWMGRESSFNDEWIELYNTTASGINLEGWALQSTDGTPEINLTGTIPAQGFYLLERTDDTTVSAIVADQIYTGALGNSGENLQLYDNSGNLVDSVDAGAGWDAGDNTTKQTMERKNSQVSGNNFDNWGTSQDVGGTPKTQNSTGATPPPQEEPLLPPPYTYQYEYQTPVAPPPSPPAQEPFSPSTYAEASADKETPGDEPQPEPITYPSGVVINEILPSPTGEDAKEEWIEIFNKNNEGVDLSGWQIADTVGSIHIYTFPEGTLIGPGGFLVLSRPTTKITLNNDGDGIQLLQPDGIVLDNISYHEAAVGQSYNRINGGFVWSTTLTPGSINVVTQRTKEVPKQEKISGAAIESVGNKDSSLPATGLAAPGKQAPRQRNASSHVFLIAAIVAVFSGAAMFLLRKKLKNQLE